MGLAACSGYHGEVGHHGEDGAGILTFNNVHSHYRCEAYNPAKMVLFAY